MNDAQTPSANSASTPEASAAQYADTTGRAVLETIRNYGVDTIFGIPGTHNLELYRPLADLGIRPVTTRHEQGAGYGADAWARRTGLPGVVICTSGPGLQNAMSAIGTAFCESRPMIVLSPGVAIGNEFADVGTLHETKDSTAMAGAIALWSRRVKSGQEAVEAVHDAFELFRSGRPRPVHIEIPLDVLERDADVPAAARAARPVDAAPKPTPTPEAIREAAKLLAGAKRPAITLGGGATRAGKPITAIAELLGAGVVTSINGKATVDETSPWSLGSNLRLETARAALQEADVLLVIGAKLGEAELWVSHLEAEGKVIRVDIADAQLEKNLASDIAIHGDATEVAEALLVALQDAGAGIDDAERTIRIAALDDLRAKIDAEIAEAAPVEVKLAKRLGELMPTDTVVAGDSSQIIYMGLANTLRQHAPNAFLYTPTYATLGYGLPAAIGARVASEAHPVATVIGDGALMFCVNEIVTAAEQQLDLVILCVDNGGYAEIKQNEVDRWMQPVGVDLLQPNWPALADALCGHGRAVTSAAELEGAVKAAFAESGVQLVHIPLSVADEL